MKPRALHVVRPKATSPDREALARVAEGDVGALGEVYDRHASALLRFAARAAGPSDAEDVVQTTFVTAAKIAASYDARTDSARAWLFGIAARIVQERRRAIFRLTRALFRVASDRPPTPPPSDAHRADLERGLGGLSESKRVVLLLTEVEGFTCEEIASMLSVPIGTVWTRLHHARKELRCFYEEGS